MTCKSSRAAARALVVFAALTTPFATLSHLAAEAASLGEASLRVLLSPHHAYLVLLNAAAAVALALALDLRASTSERRRRIALLVAALPGRGHGAVFFVCAVGTQLLFFVTTQLAEGDPIARGDVILGFLAAVLTSIVGAIVIATCKLRILRAFARLFCRLDPRNTAIPAVIDAAPAVVSLSQRLLSIPSVCNRPPPLSAI